MENLEFGGKFLGTKHSPNCFPGDVCVCQLLSVRRFSFCSSESKQESRTEAATSTGASGGRFVSSPSCAPA